MSHTAHAILTRFNLPSIGTESLIRAKDGWLKQRVGLFERYCLPSVAGQSNQNFRWITYFDPESPDWLRDRIEDWSHLTQFVPVFRSSVPQEQLVADIESVLGKSHRHLITTNLDNDDGLANDFIDRIQALPASNSPTAVYLINGLILTDSRVYLRRDRTNAFCSVMEPMRTGALTCWHDWHNLLGESMPVTELGGPPAWLQVIHGSNVSNRVRGRLASSSQYRELYFGHLDEIRDPRRVDLLLDMLVHQPVRLVRDGLRTATKRVALKVGGKEGLDRLKLALRRKRV